MRDSFGREISYLRLSVTELCNLRCRYCMPEEGVCKKAHAEMLTEDEMISVVEAASSLGIHKLRITGGEPLVKKNIISICSRAAGVEGIHEVCLTTNGTLLPRRAPALLAAPALRKVSVSLHSFEGNGGKDATDYINGVWDFAAAFAGAGRLCALRLWNEGGKETQNQMFYRFLSEKSGQDVENLPADPLGNRRLGPGLYLDRAAKFDWPAPDAPVQNVTFCYGLRRQIAVLCDGTVVPCCLDGQGVMALGNIFTTPLSAILQSPRAKAIYDGFSRRRAVEELCRRCGYAARFTP